MIQRSNSSDKCITVIEINVSKYNVSEYIVREYDDSDIVI